MTRIMSSRTWMLEEDGDELKIQMPSDTFLVKIHTSSKIIILKKMSNLKLLKNWLRDVYFELMWRIKKAKTRAFSDSNDTIIMTRAGNSIVIEAYGSGFSCLNREELMQARRTLSEIIYEIYEKKRNERNPLSLSDCFKTYDKLADCLEKPF